MNQLMLLAILFLPAPQQPPLQQQGISQPTSHNGDAKVINNFPSSAIIMEAQGEPLESPATKEENANNRDNSSWPWEFIVNLVMALATLAIAVYAVKQTNATKIAAEAAKLNAQALINSERPWFVPIVEQSMEDSALYHIKITNKGRTPGILGDVYAEHIFVDSIQRLPSPPIYKTGCFGPNDNFFVNGDSWLIPPGYPPDRMLEVYRTDINHSQVDFLVIYGKLDYRDTLAEGIPNEMIHETRWCYYWNQGETRWVRCGSDEYTGHRDYQGNKAQRGN